MMKYLWEFLLCFHENLNFLMVFQLKCEELKDTSLMAEALISWTTFNMANALPTLRGLTCQFPINFFHKNTEMIILSHSEFGKYKSNCSGLPGMSFCQRATLHNCTGRNSTRQLNCCLRTWLLIVVLRTNLYTSDCMICPVA
jgi:hypothetical protein